MNTILIVEDEALIADDIHDVTMETDGRKVVARVAAGERFDVIFCDLMMPTFSGLDVHQALSASNPEQAARIVFVTGGVFSERIADFLESVPNVQIGKPFAFESIRAIVQDYLKG